MNIPPPLTLFGDVLMALIVLSVTLVFVIQVASVCRDEDWGTTWDALAGWTTALWRSGTGRLRF